MGRLLRPALLGGVALALAGVMTMVAAVTMGGAPAGSPSSVSGARPSAAARVAPASALDPASATDATSLIAALQKRLRALPRDQRAWSSLALAYVEQSRITADPTYYPKAAAAVQRAADLAPRDSVMLTARATLRAAQHDFAGALADAESALAVNPYSGAAEAVRADALTELGRYAAALRAARRADELDPGPSTFARLSYQAELRGDLTAAAALMRRSLRSAGRSAPSYAFAAFHLGELALADGRPRAAQRWYRGALGADPGYLPALAGIARLEVARGSLMRAERDYRRVVAGLPLTQSVVELGELYEATGRPDLARQQYAVASASAQLFAANGVAVDLETALFEADHGSASAALVAARAEWARRHSIHAADALGWALHAAGRDREALRYARSATRLGTRDARLVFHLGAIEAALGLSSAAADLHDARSLDAGTSPWREHQIAHLLRSVG